MEFFATIAFVLEIALVPLFVCVACIMIDTFINFKYYLWNRELHNASKEPVCDELVNVSQYDSNFFDDGK